MREFYRRAYCVIGVEYIGRVYWLWMYLAEFQSLLYFSYPAICECESGSSEMFGFVTWMDVDIMAPSRVTVIAPLLSLR